MDVGMGGGMYVMCLYVHVCVLNFNSDQLNHN